MARAPVAVVGLGPVGAALALRLGLAGVPTLVLERDDALHSLPRAAHLDDAALRSLAPLGVAEHLLAQGRPIDGFVFADRRLRPLLRVRRRADVETGWPAATLVHQPTVEHALRVRLAAVPHVRLRLGHAVERLEEDADGVTLCGTGPDGAFSVRASHVVGCDGARSTVREAVGARLEGGRFEERWLVVDALLTRDPSGADLAVPLPADLLQVADPHAPATSVPFPGARRRWEFRLAPGESAEQAARPERVRERLGRFVEPGAVDVERAVVYAFRDLVARPWRRGRLLLAGDAAHQMPPFLGQGLGAGLADAASLGWALGLVVRGHAAPDLLDAVASERAAHVVAVTRLAVRLGRLVGAGPAAAPVRDAALRALGRTFPGGLSAPFPRVRPVLGRPPGRAVVPNPLLPDGRRLDDALGLGWAAVGVGVDAGGFARALPLPARAVRADALASWLPRTRRPPAVVLVRPDRLCFGVYAPGDAARAAADLAGALRP